MLSFSNFSSNKSDSAVIIIDMINEFCSPGGWADLNNLDYTYCDKCIDPINLLISSARQKNIPIIWLNWGLHGLENLPKNQFYLWKKKKSDVGLEAGLFQSGSKNVQVISDLDKQPNDTLVEKDRISGFAGSSNLDSVLKSKRIKKLYFAGVTTDQCVLTTMADANMLGYDCIMVKECCATNSPPYAEKAALYNAGECFGRLMSVREVLNFDVPNIEEVSKQLRGKFFHGSPGTS